MPTITQSQDKLPGPNVTAALLAVLILLLSGDVVFCSEASFTEYQVKALFLLNFTKYVDWPNTVFADAKTPITIGVYGENKFGDDLEKAVSGKSVNGRG